MSNSHHIKGSQDFHKPHQKAEKTKEMEPHISNSKKHQLINMIPLIGGQEKNMGHTNSTEDMENIIFNAKGGKFNEQPNITIESNRKNCERCMKL